MEAYRSSAEIESELLALSDAFSSEVVDVPSVPVTMKINGSDDTQNGVRDVKKNGGVGDADLGPQLNDA